VRHIKQSPLALDLYAILNREAFRANRDGKPRFLAWEWLHTALRHEAHRSRGRIDAPPPSAHRGLPSAAGWHEAPPAFSRAGVSDRKSAARP
jgi:hypothetical protein